MKALLDYKCPHCGANIKFDIDVQRMKCPHCDSEFSVSSFGSVPTDWSEDEINDLSLYACNSCGGEVVADPTAATSVCPFCDSNLVLSGRVSGKNRPDYIIPFKLDKAAAIRGFKKHLGAKKLLPKVFKSDAKIAECRGLYVPFFLFNADFKARATVRGATGGKNSRTVYFDYDLTVPFRRLPVDACMSLPNSITESLEPYYFDKDAVPFAPGYLAGNFANVHDTDKKECIKRVSERMMSNVKAEIYKDFMEKPYIYGSTKMKEAYITNHSSMYALYPVWLITAVWKNKRYTFAMNGQTGKFVGNLPCDFVSALLRFFGMFLGALAIGTLITLIVWWYMQ